MNDVIKYYLESSDAFDRLAGNDGLIDIQPYLEHSRLLEIIGADGRGRPFDADDLREIGAILIILSDKLKEKNNG